MEPSTERDAYFLYSARRLTPAADSNGALATCQRAFEHPAGKEYLRA